MYNKLKHTISIMELPEKTDRNVSFTFCFDF